MKTIIPVLFLSLIFLAIIVTAATMQVTFNGNFTNGTILYSNIYNFSNLTIQGKDAYPIRECINSTVCKTYNYTTNRTCLNYSARTGRCIKVKKEKINLGCIKYKTIKNCAPFPAICQNPSGQSTNQLKLENFYYSTDNITWIKMTYPKFNLYNIPIQFKVEIPINCTPSYDINKAIKLTYPV